MLMKTIEKLVTSIIKHRVIVIVIISVLMVAAGYQTIKKLKVDNSLSIWFLEDDPSYKAYIDFQENFGSDEIFVAMFPVENAIGETETRQLRQLHDSIEALPYVKTSFSLAKAKYPIYANNKVSFDSLYNPRRSEKGLKNLFQNVVFDVENDAFRQRQRRFWRRKRHFRYQKRRFPRQKRFFRHRERRFRRRKRRF